MQYILFWISPLALILYPKIKLIPLFWAVDTAGSTDSDVWNEVAPSPIYLSQHIVHTFYKVNDADIFVVKRRKLMNPMNDRIHEVKV